jgi:hypothetical protein
VTAFFRGFQAEQRPAAPTQRATRDARVASSEPVYTHAQIRELYAQHRKGAFAGREAEWAQIENKIFAAQREERVRGVYLTNWP